MSVTVRRLDATESTALLLLAGGTTAFAAYGLATHSPNTMPYVLTVCAMTLLVIRLRQRSMPPAVTVGLALVALAHLAGGLVTVGDDVLYNAQVGVPAVEYDHFVHAMAVFLGTVVLWTQLVSRSVCGSRRGELVVVCVLAGFGLGAVNETIEFLLTLAHGGTHVGGYSNTGWDLVSNIAGGVAAGVYVTRA